MPAELRELVQKRFPDLTWQSIEVAFCFVQKRELLLPSGEGAGCHPLPPLFAPPRMPSFDFCKGGASPLSLTTL
jgi:hypothetical protein